MPLQAGICSAAARRAPTFVNEFWTAKQRQACSLHEVSYRACFKPQLPRFFIERLTEPGEVVYDFRADPLSQDAAAHPVPRASFSVSSS